MSGFPALGSRGAAAAASMPAAAQPFVIPPPPPKVHTVQLDGLVSGCPLPTSRCMSRPAAALVCQQAPAVLRNVSSRMLRGAAAWLAACRVLPLLALRPPLLTLPSLRPPPSLPCPPRPALLQVVMKIIKHCQENFPVNVSGGLLGLDADGVSGITHR